MSTVYVTRKVHFNAAHRLHNPEKSDEWNREMFGPCNHPNWHGHNYELKVTVAGEPDPETGYVIDLGNLKALLNEEVVDKVDHKNLNLDVDFLDGVIPSTENFAIAIWNQLEGKLPSGRLHCVRLYETERNYVEYYGDGSERK
ncbi:6-pyruvoyl trahydropterin synthase family protein [Longibacter sp.]|uniref:6-pyruvoyl trahydropterin synthase family protein n=1 Tax=Longibacter sp. TaxID=2045415 RepID=UPI003EC1078D